MATTEPVPGEDDDDYDPFEEFNRSAGIGVVENPYPMFALVRAEHPMKREDFGEMMAPDGEDVELLNPTSNESVGVFTAYSFDAVQQVLKDGETFSSPGYADIMGQVFGHSILEMDEPEHHPTAGSCSRRSAARRWRRGSAISYAASSTSMLDDIVDRQARPTSSAA